MADKMEKMQVRQHYRNVWHADLMRTMVADTPYCCFAMFCSPCASYLLRRRALYNDMSRYTCCAGYMPCSGKCGERDCPEFCLCVEVWCCFANSVASTRFLLQDEFNIQTTQCDNCIIGFMFCLQQLACICSLVACILGSDEISDVAQCLNCMSDMVYCTVCACMQTQHKIEMDKRDGKFGPDPVMTIPPTQQMTRMSDPYPPQYGYPPPPQSPGYPTAGYPPPLPAQGYYIAGYPPPAPSPGYPNAGYPSPHHGSGYPPAGYPPPPQGHGLPAPGYSPPAQGQGDPGASYLSQPKGESHPPACPLRDQGHPAAGYPSPAQGQGHVAAVPPSTSHDQAH